MILTILLGVAMVAVLISLFSGLYTMFQGGSVEASQQSNKWMWYRIYAQAAALILFAALLFSGR